MRHQTAVFVPFNPTAARPSTLKPAYMVRFKGRVRAVRRCGGAWQYRFPADDVTPDEADELRRIGMLAYQGHVYLGDGMMATLLAEGAAWVPGHAISQQEAAGLARLFGAKGYSRDARIFFAETITGRKIRTFRALTPEEARRIRRALLAEDARLYA